MTPQSAAPVPPAPAAAPDVVTLRKSGTLLEVSATGAADPAAALPAAARRVLEPVLQYQHKRFLYGAERRSPDGTLRRVLVTDRQLYRYDQYGRMVTGAGFARRVHALLRGAGFPVRCLTVRGDRERDRDGERPSAYVARHENVRGHFTFRARQEECLRAVAANGCGIVHAATGFGKLVLICMICLAFPHAQIHVVVRRTQLAHKIWRFLLRHLPDVGLVGAGKKSFGRRITVFTADSLHHASPFDADLLLCDEAHELLADEYSESLARYELSRNFGFTASPEGRADGTDARLESLFGQTVFHLPYWEAVEHKLAVPIRVEWCDVVLDRNPAAEKEGTPKLRWGVWRNRDRNQVVADKVRSFGADDQVLVLVDTVEHAVFLRQHLPDFVMVFGANEIGRRDLYLRHEMATEEDLTMNPRKLEQLRVDFEAGRLKKVIATDVWSTGIDPVQLTALVRAAPDNSKIMSVQAPGRVSRIIPGKEQGVVVDFRDQFDTGFHRSAKTRFGHYKAMRWEQTLTTPAGPVPLKGA